MKEESRVGLRNAVASTMANVIEHVLHPLDLIRIRMQSHDGRSKGNAVPKYSGILNALQTILKEEGIRGLYKGFVITLVATNISKFLYFGLYGYQQSLFRQRYGAKSKRATTYAAMVSGFICTVLTAPVWTLKTRMVLNTSTVKGTTNLTETIQQIISQHGAKGFFRGLPLSMLLSFHGVIQMTFYEYFKMALNYTHDNTSQESWKPMLCGGGSKIIALTVMFPITLIRTRIQQNQFTEADHAKAKYRNTVDVIKKTAKFEGIRGFYKGYTANLIRSTPSSAIFFFFFEFFKKKLPF